jgi:hypothetical protein
MILQANGLCHNDDDICQLLMPIILAHIHSMIQWIFTMM